MALVPVRLTKHHIVLDFRLPVGPTHYEYFGLKAGEFKLICCFNSDVAVSDCFLWCKNLLVTEGIRDIKELCARKSKAKASWLE